MPICRIHDFVEANGKTIRENNLDKQHSFDIGTLVEIADGVRMFVVMHTRDCDGTPLYTLTAFKDDFEDIERSYKYMRYNWIGGISEDGMSAVPVFNTEEEAKKFRGDSKAEIYDVKCKEATDD